MLAASVVMDVTCYTRLSLKNKNTDLDKIKALYAVFDVISDLANFNYKDMAHSEKGSNPR